MKVISYIEFSTYPLSEKVDFFDNGIASIVQSVEDSQLYKFLRQIILNVAENAFIRKSAVSILVESVFLGKIKNRQAISILVDEWEDSPHVFVELQRVKDLFYFFDVEPDINNIYNSYLKNEELEIVTEALLNLGFIHLQKGFEAVNKDDKISCFQAAIQYFNDSDNSIENRIDAKFYRVVSSILFDFLSLKTANIDNQLNQLAVILKEKWLYSFDFNENVMDVSFYKTLTSISNIKKENPTNWTEYHIEFNKLYECYSDVKNQKIKNRLNKSKLSHTFVAMCEESFIEPYFALNFHSQMVKIDNCIKRYSVGSPLYDFLTHIKKLANNNDFKKKVDTKTVEQKLKNCFPKRSPAAIEKTLKKIKDPKNPDELINAFEELNAPSIDKFIDSLVFACITLQGDRIYKFSNRSNIEENDRNKFIAQLLRSADYSTNDQSLWGESPGGKKDGEIDLMFYDSRGLPFAIIEALNWRDYDYLKTHIDKLFNKYDTAGFENNFIVVYANAKKFGALCKKYIDCISKHNYKHVFQCVNEIDGYNYAELKIYKAEHIRHGGKVFLYHIIINFNI
ncbi:hypothetical protein ACFO3O_12795 [Dokdonia ponticola]|uniref:Uncharacterized protein n=1 Tax=Dokdonia ponticola TaxID=2041041 RepID=A0ABV9HX79_9FLAO